MSKILKFLGGQDEPLDDLVEQYREMDRDVKRLTLDAGLLKAKIIQRMGSADFVENRHGNIIATYKEYQREDFDKKGLAALYPEQYQIFVRMSTYKMFKLK